MRLLEALRAVAAPPPPAAPADPNAPTLVERLGRTNRVLPEGSVLASVPRLGRPAVGWSRDLERICELPRRQLEATKDSAAARYWTGRLRKPDAGPCDCAKRFGFCISELLNIQGWALDEACEAQGLIAPIGVGHGKTGIDLLLPHVFEPLPGRDHVVALLLIPPNLRAQLSRVDIPQWGEHFQLPNIGGGRFFTPRLPVLHVVAYSELSSPKASDLLERIAPDLIIADEAHNLRRRESARTKRFLRYFTAHPETRACFLSGTITSKTIKDYAHLSAIALRESSPVPIHWPTVEEWAGAIDASDNPAPIGDLARLCRVGESARTGYRRRLVETAGVVATEESALGTSLIIAERRPRPDLPPDVRQQLGCVRDLWQRPDGEELTDAMTRAAVARQVACGFFYRWIWPRGEPRELILEWLAARKEWHREVREKLKHSREFMDSPMLVTKAAIRWHDGFAHVDEQGKRHVYPPHTRHALTWAAEFWPRWRDVREKCEPETEAVWISDYLARDAATWATSNRGIVWYEHDAFGKAVAKLADVPLFGAGPEASAKIIEERGSRSIVASIRAHGTGKNLQQAFASQLVANPPPDGAVWEQLLGRTHRQGQPADEVTAEVYRHVDEMAEALEKARERARYIQETTGSRQKLLYATYDLD